VSQLASGFKWEDVPHAKIKIRTLQLSGAYLHLRMLLSSLLLWRICLRAIKSVHEGRLALEVLHKIRHLKPRLKHQWKGMMIVKKKYGLWRQRDLDSNASFFFYLLDNADHP